MKQHPINHQQRTARKCIFENSSLNIPEKNNYKSMMNQSQMSNLMQEGQNTIKNYLRNYNEIKQKMRFTNEKEDQEKRNVYSVSSQDAEDQNLKREDKDKVSVEPEKEAAWRGKLKKLSEKDQELLNSKKQTRLNLSDIKRLTSQTLPPPSKVTQVFEESESPPEKKRRRGRGRPTKLSQDFQNITRKVRQIPSDSDSDDSEEIRAPRRRGRPAQSAEKRRQKIGKGQIKRPDSIGRQRGRGRGRGRRPREATTLARKPFESQFPVPPPFKEKKPEILIIEEKNETRPEIDLQQAKRKLKTVVDILQIKRKNGGVQYLVEENENIRWAKKKDLLVDGHAEEVIDFYEERILNQQRQSMNSFDQTLLIRQE